MQPRHRTSFRFRQASHRDLGITGSVSKIDRRPIIGRSFESSDEQIYERHLSWESFVLRCFWSTVTVNLTVSSLVVGNDRVKVVDL